MAEDPSEIRKRTFLKEATQIFKTIPDEDIGYFASVVIRDMTIMYPDAWQTHGTLGRRIKTIVLDDKGEIQQGYWAAAQEIMDFGHPSQGRDIVVLLSRLATPEAFLQVAWARQLLDEKDSKRE